MRHSAIMIEPEERLITQADSKNLARQILGNRHHSRIVVAIDGACGTGKSVISSILFNTIRREIGNIAHVSTDSDVLSRADRKPGTNVMDWHGDDMVKEIMQNPGAEFHWEAYGLQGKTKNDVIHIATPEIGIVILEGLHAIEKTLKYQGRDDEIIAINVTVPEEIRERRRKIRNIETGRWNAKEADEREKYQRATIRDYYEDLRKKLGANTGTRTATFSRLK